MMHQKMTGSSWAPHLPHPPPPPHTHIQQACLTCSRQSLCHSRWHVFLVDKLIWLLYSIFPKQLWIVWPLAIVQCRTASQAWSTKHERCQLSWIWHSLSAGKQNFVKTSKGTLPGSILSFLQILSYGMYQRVSPVCATMESIPAIWILGNNDLEW